MAETRVTRAQLQAAGRAVEERDRLIRRALSEGWKQQDVAEILGLSKGRISQIASAKQPSQESDR